MTWRCLAITFLFPLLLLGACGGGDPVTSHPFVSQIAAAAPSSQRMQAASIRPAAQAAAAAAAISATDLFEYAERTYPDLFPDGPQNFDFVFEGKTYTLRSYPQGRYIGVADGIVYGLGDFTNNAVQSFGPLVDFTCAVAPQSCVAQPPTGALNECIDPAAGTLPNGFKVTLVYDYSGLVVGEVKIDSVIGGTTTFEGQSAVEVASTTTSSSTVSAGGVALTTSTTTVSKTYEQSASSGLFKTLGALADITVVTPATTVGGITVPSRTVHSQTKTVFNPALENTEYTLQLGQSVTRTTSQTTTIVSSPLLPPTTTSSSEVYTFEKKESIPVFGKVYSTCRYKVSGTDGTRLYNNWVIVGKGIPVMTETVSDGGTQIVRLKSGTYNGVAL